MVALILWIDAFQIEHLDFPSQISHSIEILREIQGYRGDVHHPSFILVPGSCILVKVQKPATGGRIGWSTGEDGGFHHHPHVDDSRSLDLF